MDEALSEPRFELVSCSNSYGIARLIRLVLHFVGFKSQVSEARLSGPELQDFLSGLKAGPYLPAFFDNAACVEISQPLAAIQYIARVAVRGGSIEPAFLGSSDTNKLRAELATEVVLKFVRENAQPAEGETDRNARAKRLQQQLKTISTIILQSSAVDEGTGMEMTFGDIAAWFFMHTAVKQCGPLALASHPDIGRLYTAFSSIPAVREFVSSETDKPDDVGESVGASLPSNVEGVSSAAGTVLVTGASGFIASWVVKILLEKGYRVRGTVRPTADPTKHDHLMRLPGAQERLQLIPADLLDPVAWVAPMAGCCAVLHCASPFFFESGNPAEELIKPAVQGTQHVLRAAIATTSVRKIIVTSSVAAVYVTKKPSDHFYSEADWSDLSYIRETKQHYAESKMLAEMEAWRIMREELPPERKGLQLCTVCPTQTVGPLLQPTLNTSCSSILDLLSGSKPTISNKAKCFVDVRDVALCHVLAMENPTAIGRYVLIATSIAWRTAADILRNTLPSARVPTEVEAGPAPPPQALSSIKKVHDLGISYTPIEDSLRDCALSLYASGFLNDVIPPAGDSRQPGSE